MRALSVLALACVLSLPTSSQADERRGFTYPLTRHARDQAALAAEHVAEERWDKAISVLQEMISIGEVAVLPDAFRASADQLSVHLAHPGAGAWARTQLANLPASARARYRDRYGRDAEAALEEAVRRRDRRALVAVADRWPLCDASIRAWWILGDLELEEGHAHTAMIAWQRGQEMHERVHGGAPQGLAARLALAHRSLDEGAHEEGAFVPFPDNRIAERGPLPSGDAKPWTTELDLAPFGNSISLHSLRPALDGANLFVTSSLEVYALDTYSGELRWRSGRPAGWERLMPNRANELFTGIDQSTVRIAPAVGGGIVVAALQLPYTQYAHDEIQGIDIMEPIPERRLHAFDAETGALLWSHAPELRMEQGRPFSLAPGELSFAESMKVTGPPVVAGSRVLVPCIGDLEGRMYAHVACYELETGEELWSTGIVSGQVPRNMFGRAELEFCSTPVVIARDRVIVQSELGTVAALDLMSGRILWESLYDQVPLPRSPGYSYARRPKTWRLAPPVVADGVVLSTPSDSGELTAFDLEDGRVLWTQSRLELSRLGGATSNQAFDLLVGADEDAFYLSGPRLARIGKPGGLRTPGLRVDWRIELDTAKTRPVLTAKHVLVPLPAGRLVLDRRDGREVASLSARWEDQYGTALVGNGQLFMLGRRSLSGTFDWDLLLARQEKLLAQTPGDAGATVDTAGLYARRAEAALEASELFAARGFLQRGRTLLEPVLERLSSDGDGDAGLYRAAADELHGILRSEARALGQQGDRAGALTALGRALRLTSSPTEVRDTLLETELHLRATNRRAAHLEVLARLEEESGRLPLPYEASLTSLVPIDLDAQGETTLTVGTWVLLTRADVLVGDGQWRAAFEDWHTLIDRHAEVRLSASETAGELASRRIAGLLRDPRGREAYEPFESRASELYARALEAESQVGLEDVGRRFPHSRAAVEADRARLDWAYADGDAAYVASIVARSRRSGAATDDTGPMLRLARAFGRQGNRELERAILERLATERPRATSDLEEDEGRTIPELLAALGDEAPAAGADTGTEARFGLPSRMSPIRSGSFDFVGRLPSDGQSLHVYVRRPDHVPRSHRIGRGGSARAEIIDEVEAYASTGAMSPVWTKQLEEPIAGVQTTAVSGDRVLLGGRRSVQAYDASGALRWTHRTPARIDTIDAHRGVAVLLLGVDQPAQLVGLDAHGGTPLWELSLADRNDWRAPLIGDGYAVLFSRVFRSNVLARVVDVFRGTVVANIDLGLIEEANLERCSWIADGKLLIPTFRTLGGRRQKIEAFDLLTGRPAWTCPTPESENLRSIALADGVSYLVTASEEFDVSGGVYSLDPAFGSLRKIVSLRPGEQPIGLPARELTRLPSPDLFTYTEESAKRILVRALHLPYQARWTTPLRVLDLDPRLELPLPALSEDTVALYYVERNPHTGRRGQPWLAFLDRTTGQPLETRMVDEDFGYADRLELRGLGSSLFLTGHGNLTRGWRMQILEQSNQR